MIAQRSTLTLQDVADLAGVRRHVVTGWRGRTRVRGRYVPFPTPVAVTGGVQHFDPGEIVDYLATTGRGNNRGVGQDAPALAVPEGVDIEDAVTMLCLHAQSGAELAGLAAAELVALARRVDPADRFLLREVRAVAHDAALLRHVDDLVEASFGAPDALTRAESGRLRRRAPERGPAHLLVDLVRAVAGVARLHLADEGVALVPPADRALTRPLVEGFAGLLLDDGPTARAEHRRALIDGFAVVDDAPAAVRVLSLMGAPDALAALDEFALSLPRTDVGVVVGPAGVLCDPLVGEPARDRSRTLRGGHVLMAVRLPRGLWKAAPRQSLALWVLDGAGGATDAWLADLDTDDAVVLDDLASDVLAALRRTTDRAYRYARRCAQAAVLAAPAVVPRGVRAVRLARVDAATHVDRIHTATLTTSRTLAGYDVTVVPAPGQLVVRRRSLGELAAERRVGVLRGRRVDPAHGVADGTVAVRTGDGSADGLRLDPFDAERRYPRALRTEPGDVVFLERPRPAARVDPRGGALVASPSRVLRLAEGAPIGPHALAAIINGTAGGEWASWSVPDLAPDEAAALDAALAAAADHRDQLRRHERALHDLTRDLIEGVAAGAITISPATIHTTKAG